MIAVWVATFMLLLDITVVTWRCRRSAFDLGASFTDLEWVFDACALTLAAQEELAHRVNNAVPEYLQSKGARGKAVSSRSTD